ncbi:UDP-N-acetyl-D-mannosamine dehydrogenase [compost metagenome]
MVEPNINVLPEGLTDLGIHLISAEQAIKQADVIVILVDHKEFKSIDWASINYDVVDTRGLISK